MTLLSTHVPRVLIDKAIALATLFNELVHNVSIDTKFILKKLEFSVVMMVVNKPILQINDLEYKLWEEYLCILKFNIKIKTSRHCWSWLGRNLFCMEILCRH